MGEICTVCRKECRGGFSVSQRQLADGTPEIAVDSTPDRNFNVCDICNDVICFDCSTDPGSGYCNSCYSRVAKNA